MARREVVVLASDLLLEAVDFGRKKFPRTAAFRAHHVMVAAAVVLVLVAGEPIMKSDFVGKAALGQQLERAINRGKADLGVLLLHQPVQFADREVLACFQEGTQNGVALRRMFQAHTFQMTVQDRLRLADHLPRDGGLVVDALLQHDLCRNSSGAVPGGGCGVLRPAFDLIRILLRFTRIIPLWYAANQSRAGPKLAGLFSLPNCISRRRCARPGDAVLLRAELFVEERLFRAA